MAVTIDFLPWAIGGGANVESQADYVADPSVTNGITTGLAKSSLYNKTARQSGFVSAAVANYMGNVLNKNILDDGNLLEFWANFWESLIGASYFVDSGVASAILTANPFGLTFDAPFPGLKISVLVAHTNTGPVTFNWMGTGNKNVVYGDGTPILAGDFPASGLITLMYDGTSWQAVAMSRSGVNNLLDSKIIITAEDVYISNSGNDFTGQGTVASPWKTLQGAYNNVTSASVFGGGHVNIHIPDDTYNFAGNATATSSTAAGAGGVLVATEGNWVLVGNVGSPDNVIINQTASGQEGCIIAQNNASITINGMKPATASGFTFEAVGGGKIAFENVDFGPPPSGTTGAHVAAAFGGICTVLSNYSISGNATNHYYIQAAGSQIIGAQAQTLTITLTGTPAFTTFASLTDLAYLYINHSNQTFSGSATGARYYINNLAGIQTTGGGATYLPGNAGGSIDTGGGFYA